MAGSMPEVAFRLKSVRIDSEIITHMDIPSEALNAQIEMLMAALLLPS